MSNRNVPVIVILLLSLALVPHAISARTPTIKLQLASKFLSKDVSVITGERWTGLFREGRNFILREEVVRVNKIDPEKFCGYEKEITVNESNEPFLLLKGFPKNREQQIKPANEFTELNGVVLYENVDVRHLALFTFSNQSKLGIYVANNQIFAELSGKHQSLATYVTREPPDVNWVGDIDQDGKLDLLITFPIAGSKSETALFLSSGAAKDRVLGKVASTIYSVSPC